MAGSMIRIQIERTVGGNKEQRYQCEKQKDLCSWEAQLVLVVYRIRQEVASQTKLNHRPTSAIYVKGLRPNPEGKR